MAKVAKASKKTASENKTDTGNESDDHLSIKLVPYLLEFKPRQRGVDKPPAEGLCFLSEIEKFLKSIKELNVDNAKKEVLRIKETKKGYAGNYRVLTGIIESGNFGEEFDLQHIDTKVVSKVTHNQAQIRPFVFLFFFPKGKNRGYVILEKRGPHGVKSFFKSKLDLYVQERLGNGFVCEWSLHCDEEFIKAATKNAKAREIRIKRTIYRNEVEQTDNDEKLGIWSIAYRPPFGLDLSGLTPKSLMSWLRGQPGCNSVLVEGFVPTETTLVIKVDGKDVNYSVEDDGSGQFRASRDVTSLVDKDSVTKTRCAKSLTKIAYELVSQFPML